MRWIVLALLFFASSSQAQSTGIQVLDEEYSTTLSNSVQYFDCPGCTPSYAATLQQTTSTTPLEKELQTDVSDCPGPSCPISAKGSADMFSVSTEAIAFIPCPRDEPCEARAHATAEASLSFRVLQDTTVSLTFAGQGGAWSYSFFSLFDQTIGQSLFSHGVGRGYFGEPFSSVAFSGLLNSDHIYALTLRGDSGADGDYYTSSLDVYGLYPIAAPVPEPSTWAMMLAGLVFVGGVARRRRSRSR